MSFPHTGPGHPPQRSEIILCMFDFVRHGGCFVASSVDALKPWGLLRNGAARVRHACLVFGIFGEPCRRDDNGRELLAFFRWIVDRGGNEGGGWLVRLWVAMLPGVLIYLCVSEGVSRMRTFCVSVYVMCNIVRVAVGRDGGSLDGEQ